MKLSKPPLDNPLRRHEETSSDRILGSEGKRLAELRLTALERLREMQSAQFEGPVPPTPGMSNWVQMGPTAIPKGQTYSPSRVLVTGRVTAIAVDPINSNIIYLGAAQGGIWKTTDGGKTWAAKSDNEVSLAIGALAMDPTNHLVLYVGTGEGNFAGDSYYGNGVLKTVDGGNTWTLQGASTFGGFRFSRIVINPSIPSILFAATSVNPPTPCGVFRSTNGGTNWAPMTSGLPTSAATDLAINPTNPDTVYAAFWGQGIYRTTNGSATNPTWTKLVGGLPSSGFTRIALGISPSSPQTVYALMAKDDWPNYTVDKFYWTTNGGNAWSSIALPGGNIGTQGFYNLNVAIDPTTPDIVYLSGMSVWKAVRSGSGAWTITEVGGPIHADNHAFAFDPTNHLTVYAGNDGGIYKSNNGGGTWDDSINKGPCITQFEFIDQHPASDAVVLGGTQDNGTEQFRNSQVFYHAKDGDGGFVAVDFNQPNNIISTYYSNSPYRSTQGGKFGTWTSVSPGIIGNGLFYPPMALCDTSPANIAFGTDRINLDPTQGTSGWPTKVALPGIGTALVTAIHYVNSNLIYAATSFGQVYRLKLVGSTWTATAIHASPLPSRFVWDIATQPGTTDTVILVMSGFGTAHVWRGVVPATGTATWTNISGSGSGQLPDIPVNALAIEPTAPNTMYIATDIAVFRTTDGGATWGPFSQGLPNCAVFDMRLHDARRLLRVGTHGRGMWERKLDVLAMPDVNIFVRDHLMDTGRLTPSPSPSTAAFEDPTQYVALGNQLWWWMCADVKVDALEGSTPSYQMNVSDVDYLAFESNLVHRNPQRGKVNRVYIQIHNRGIQTAANVTVKILYASAAAGLPTLPSDFWTAFPGNSTNTTNWHPIGSAKVIPAIPPGESRILEWDWSTPTTASDHSCLLVITDCPTDSIPPASKVFNIGSLVPNERHAGLKNLHVVDPPPLATSYSAEFAFFGNPQEAHMIRFVPSSPGDWDIGIMFEEGGQKQVKLKGARPSKPTKQMLLTVKKNYEASIRKYDLTTVYMVEDTAKGGNVEGVSIPKGELHTLLFFTPTRAGRQTGAVSVVQLAGKRVEGGSTFVLRSRSQT